MDKRGYHFSSEGKMSHGDDRRIQVGVKYHALHEGGAVARKAVWCGVGMHAATEPLAAWVNISGDFVSLVTVHDVGTDKSTDDDYSDRKFVGLSRTHHIMARLTNKEVDDLNDLEAKTYGYARDEWDDKKVIAEFKRLNEKAVKICNKALLREAKNMVKVGTTDSVVKAFLKKHGPTTPAKKAVKKATKKATKKAVAKK